eukprot:TRINITY_DN13574_c0_g1_i1.p1 TRINITY_DN13574_c0_g1~~TRINITY_DN13574_c0_g1_i1.p1  ORF type:complete len:550 (+),score=117.82 TRINITY_DN13574_c0_g1_i1:52-1701(+)
MRRKQTMLLVYAMAVLVMLFLMTGGGQQDEPHRVVGVDGVSFNANEISSMGGIEEILSGGGDPFEELEEHDPTLERNHERESDSTASSGGSTDNSKPVAEQVIVEGENQEITLYPLPPPPTKNDTPEAIEAARQYSFPGGVVFTPSMMPRFMHVSGHGRSPKTPDAPTGKEALQLARSYGLPDNWNGRLHPTIFILGAPKAGTTFLEKCISAGALAGDDVHKPYPRPSHRWPTPGKGGSEPRYWGHTSYNYDAAWNRTGFRRWDLGKEPRVYRNAGNSTNPRYYRLFESFPPVEPEAMHWGVLDATPSYLMSPGAAENVALDHRHNINKPRFVIVWREGMSRSFSHYVMIMGKNPMKYKDNAFIKRMHFELAKWNKPGCEALRDDPESLLADDAKEKLRSVQFRCFGAKSYFGHSLPVLGLRYWLHFFSPEQFTVIRTDAMKKADHMFIIEILEKAFNYKRAKPQCKPEEHWNSSTCTPRSLYTGIVDNCRDAKQVGQARKASYSNKADSLNLNSGTEEDKKPFLDIYKKYDKLFLDLIKKYNIRYYDK